MNMTTSVCSDINNIMQLTNACFLLVLCQAESDSHAMEPCAVHVSGGKSSNQ